MWGGVWGVGWGGVVEWGGGVGLEGWWWWCDEQRGEGGRGEGGVELLLCGVVCGVCRVGWGGGVGWWGGVRGVVVVV